MAVQKTVPTPDTSPVTSTTVLRIALPMTLGYLSTPLVGLVDTAAIGQLGLASLIAAIAVGAIIFDFIFATFNFLRSGTTGMVAQAYGAEDSAEQVDLFFRSLTIGIVLGLAVVLIRGPILQLGLYLLDSSETVRPAVETYFNIRVLATPFSLINYVVLGWLIGCNKPGWALTIQLLLNGINAALDGIFVLVFDWGVSGVAWGTVIAETTAAIIGIALIGRMIRGLGTPTLASIFDSRAFRRLFAVNVDIMIRTFCLMFAFGFFVAQGQKYGDTILAANAVLIQFFLLSGFVLDGLATSAEQLVGAALGARRESRFRQAFKISMLWSVATAAFISVLIWFAGRPAIGLITTAEDVRAIAYQFLPYAALTPIAGVIAFHLDGVFIGATWTVPMRNMMLLSLIIYVLFWYLFGTGLGNPGLWISILIFLATRGLTLWLMVPIMRTRAFA